MQHPLGFCQCGCGQRTSISPSTDKSHGYVAGQPRLWINGHSKRQPRTIVETESGYATPCLIWHGPMTKGYGWEYTMRMNAHKAAWTREHGDIPDGFVLHHLCRQLLCVRVDHLQLLTPTEHRKIHQGESGRKNKLTLEEVQDIRTSPWSLNDIADKYGISKPYASHVRRGLAPKEFAVAPDQLPHRDPTPQKLWNKGVSRLTANDVRAIRASRETLAVIAGEHGITMAYASQIRNGKALAHIT